MKSVVLVEPDARTRKEIAAHLAADQDRYRLCLAETGEEALGMFDSEDVFLVISDARLPDMTGPALLRRVHERHGDIETVLTAADPDPQTMEAARRQRCLDLLEKPLDVERLRKLITDQHHLHGEGFAGTLKHIQLDDLIQMCCPSGVSLTIRVRRAKEEGIIYIEDGEIVHAVCEQATGEEAFYRILGWRGGYFETLGARRVSERTIDQNYGYLIMEAARRADEDAADDDCRSEQKPAAEECAAADKLRVLLVDDSPMMCKVLGGLLVADGDIEIVGTADNGEKALAMCSELKPDLVALDVNMPVMDGRTTLKHIMIQHPCPVVIMSNVVRGGEASVMEFLTLGAVDFISKPVRNERLALQHQKIRERVRAAARARVAAFSRPRASAPKAPPPQPDPDDGPCRSLVIVNAGAGGFVELIDLMGGLAPGIDAAVVGLQTIPPAFCPALIEYARPRAAMPVAPIGDRMPLRAGCWHLGINGVPLEVEPDGETGWRLRTAGAAGSPPSREHNHFDGFLRSVATAFDGPVTVVLLSGADVVCVKGLRMVRERGANILVRRLDKAVAPDTLEPVIAEGIATAEADTDALVEEIAAVTNPAGP